MYFPLSLRFLFYHPSFNLSNFLLANPNQIRTNILATKIFTRPLGTHAAPRGHVRHVGEGGAGGGGTEGGGGRGGAGGRTGTPHEEAAP